MINQLPATDEAEMREILAQEWEKSFSKPDVSHPYLLQRVRDGQIDEIPLSVAFAAMRSYASLVRERTLDESAQLADMAATQELGKFKDIKDAMLGRAVLDGWQSASKQVAVLIRLRKSKESQ